MLERRAFLGTLVAAAAAAAAPTDFPNKQAKVEKLFKSPEEHPNALEASKEGLWIADQVTEDACLVDWKTGKLIRTVKTESCNTSGMAYGGGYLWMAANGLTTRRPRRPTDSADGAVVKVDPATGKTVGRYPPPGGGGVHGLEYASDGLWIDTPGSHTLSLVDPKDFHLIHQIPMKLDRSHGLARDKDGIWAAFATDRVIQKLDVKDGTVLAQLTLSKEDPQPHGLCMHAGFLYYCDAGFAEAGQQTTNSPGAAWICRIKV